MLKFKFGSKFEPFPAVLLPSGAIKVLVGSDEFKAEYTAIYAQKDGSWGRINPELLLYPIPVTYHIHIISREFGLNDPSESGDRRLSRLLIKLNVLRTRKATEKDKEKAKNWLMEKIKAQGFTEPVLRIAKKEEIISIKSGEILSENVIYEKDLYLD